MVIYGTSQYYPGRFSTEVINRYLCPTELTLCVQSGTIDDSSSGHTICKACNKITVRSGLRKCVGCEREYINTVTYEDDTIYEPNCLECE